MMLPMMKTDQKNTSANIAPCTDEKEWNTLFANIRELAMRKTQRMLREENFDEDVADRDARSLRTLMGAAEITARLKHIDEKEKGSDGETQRAFGHTEEELDVVFERVRARIDRLAAEESAGTTGTIETLSDRDAERAAGRECNQGVA